MLLPETPFGMRADAKRREPEMQAWWAENGVYERLAARAAAGAEPYTLHDGPPYANGDLHIGHALNKILKDFVNRFQMLQGRSVRYVPGWDCHGLPIELKVLQSMKSSERRELSPLQLRRRARDFALETVEKQKAQFQRYGVWGDWDAPYLTLDPAYEAAQLGVFGRMFEKGHIYRGLKPVHWSPSSGTALAEAELEYPEGHVSQSIYVALPLSGAEGSAAGAPGHPAAEALGSGRCALAVWTTTPWTMPGNSAVAVNDRLEYSVCERGGGGGYLIVASDLVAAVAEKLGPEGADGGGGLREVARVSGADLEGCTYSHPLYAAREASPVVVGGDYITTETGTGLVHTAPGHGAEDYAVGLRCGLPLRSPVDGRGNFTAEAGAEFEGLNVLKGANDAVIAALEREGALLLEEAYGHKYPYDWRTKKPTIFRATEQWFASVDGFKEEALAQIEGPVDWLPASGQNRIAAMTAGRSDWCISRQRAWGVPIPAFYDKETGEELMTPETIAHVQAIVAERGSDAWFELDVAELLPESLRSRAPELRKGTDTMDVWFDSGSSWASVVQGREGEGLRWPANLYLEGSDQHRGWFQSSLLTAVAATGRAPYERVLTHGFVLDEKGAKMSKSVGNVVDPRLVIEGGNNQKTEPAYGADVLRLWVSSVDYTSDVLVGPNILKQAFEGYRKVRGTLRFVLGNLNDFDPGVHAVPLAELPALDRCLLHQLAELERDCRAAYAGFQFSRVHQAVQKFCVVDLSNYYLDVCKDRLYIEGADAFPRRSAQTVLHHIARVLLGVLAPILPHTAEDAWRSLPFDTPAVSVFEAGWPESPAEWTAPAGSAELALWGEVRALRGAVNSSLEAARSAKLIGSSLEARVEIHVADAGLGGRLQGLCGGAGRPGAGNGVDELANVFLVSQVEVVGAEPEGEHALAHDLEGLGRVVVGVRPARGCKCDRCWRISEDVGASGRHPLLCERCVRIVDAMGIVKQPGEEASALA